MRILLVYALVALSVPALADEKTNDTKETAVVGKSTRISIGGGTGFWPAPSGKKQVYVIDAEADFLVSEHAPIYMGPDITYFQYGRTPIRFYQTLLAAYYKFGETIHPELGIETGITYNAGRSRDMLGATLLFRPALEYDIADNFAVAGQVKLGIVQNAKLNFGTRSRNDTDSFFFGLAQLNALYSF